MDRCCVSGAAKQTIKGIHLANEMTLAQSAYGRITAHCTQSGPIESDKRCGQTHSRCDACRLAPGVPAPDNHKIEIHHHGNSPKA
ncbi:hypothetical protein GCM10011411_22540 [Aurantiacibacter arachoides]|nr:hypothetical protein GCM10011411_22540 [Aurantiacibacter arachoides]